MYILIFTLLDSKLVVRGRDSELQGSKQHSSYLTGSLPLSYGDTVFRCTYYWAGSWILTEDLTSDEKTSIPMKLSVLKYCSEKFLKENMLPNSTVLYFNSIKSFLLKQVTDS
jgi:hypothetical protein